MSLPSHDTLNPKGETVSQTPEDQIWPAGFVRQFAATIFYVAGSPIVDDNGIAYVRSAKGVTDLLQQQVRAGNVTADHRETQKAALALGAKGIPEVGQELHENCYFPWTEREMPRGTSPHGQLNAFLARYIGGASDVRKISADVAREVVGPAAGQNHIDVCSLAEQMSSMVTARLLKLPSDYIPEMQEAVKEYEQRQGPFDWLKPSTPQFKQALAKLFKYYSDQPGFVHDVAVEYAAGKISIEQRNALIWGAYAAAYGTTATAINLMVAHIIGFGLQGRLLANRTNPQFKQQLRLESLRIGSPMSAVPLFVTRDTVCDKLQLRKGQIVFAVLSAANLDPQVFADPYRFDPDRQGLDRHMAYGHGLHKCIGLHWANAEIDAALDAMIEYGFFSSDYRVERIERNVNLVDVVTKLSIVRQ